MLIFRSFEHGKNRGGKNQKKPCISWNCIKLIYLHTNLIFILLKYPIPQSSKTPNKIKQNPKSPPPIPLSYPISTIPTKIDHFPSFTTQKSIPQTNKNLPTILKSSLFIGTFTDNVFSPQKSPKSSLTTSLTQGVLKNCT